MSETSEISVASQKPGNTVSGFDVSLIKADFPILKQLVNGHPLVYLDNAATTQKPEAVIEAISHYYRHDNANVHRGSHALSDRATARFEGARDAVASFINSPDSCQVIWVRGVTEGINLVAHSWGRSNLQAGDKVLVPWLEHHADIVPWQLVCAERGAELVPIPILDSGDIDLDAFDALLDERVKMVALNHVSNALGTVNPVAEIIRKAHAVGAKVLVDGAQAIAHYPVDVQALDCDFYTFSGHKLFGPTGIGVLWGKQSLLDAMPPFLGGGEMIETVSFSGSTYNRLPFKFEAGTPNIAGVIGLAAAIAYLQGIDRVAAAAHEAMLLDYTLELAADIAGLQRIGAPGQSVAIFSFLLAGTHPSDLGMLLDQQGIAVRTGQHCAQPLMARLGVPGTTRASYSIYNTREDVDALMVSIRKAKSLFG
jgi:cysteine desulfurase/selenocysteine lyase